MVVRRRGRHLGEPAQLAQSFLSSFFGHAGRFDLFAQLFHFLLLVALAQFLLNRFHLFAKIILPLALRHLILDVGLNLRPELLQFDLARQVPVQTLQPSLELEALKQFLLLNGRQRREV